MLRGIERDSFGVEIGRLCLALADYPNPNGWNIEEDDVFRPRALTEALGETSIVLCNPPFEWFSESEKTEYKGSFWTRPAELMSRILDGLCRPDAVLGFVLPRTFLDGQDYRKVRGRLAERFATIDLVSLPDRGWEHVAPETALLIAKGQRKGDRVSITQGIVREQNWQAFDWYHEVASRDADLKTTEEARESFMVPELRDVWEFLDYCPKIGEVAEVHKGIRWNVDLETHESSLVQFQR